MAETPWLRTPDGRVRLQVLKTFYFVHKAQGSGGALLPQSQQRRFEAGEHLLDPEKPEDAMVLEHPWICADFADGHIESPDQMHARLETEEAKRTEVRERQAALLRETEMVSRRTIAALESQGHAQSQAGDDMQSELNTPLNQPRLQSAGSGLDTPLNKF